MDARGTDDGSEFPKLQDYKKKNIQPEKNLWIKHKNKIWVKKKKKTKWSLAVRTTAHNFLNYEITKKKNLPGER
jgi:hypothetical protein